MSAVEPILHEVFSGRLQTSAFALRDLILVMREDEVFAAQMQIEAGPEDFHAHGAALDVPARPAFAPRARPEYAAIFGHARFPEGKVGDGLFGILVALHPLAGPHLIEI